MFCDAKKLMMISVQGQMLTDRHVPPFMVWSHPGEGKTAVAEMMVEAFSIDYFHKDAAPQKMPADFAGYAAPDFDKGVMNMLPPKHAKEISTLDGTAFILYDELADAPRSVQSAAHGPLLDKTLGELKMQTMDNGIAQGACSNPPTTNTTGESLSMAVRNRLFHIEWDESVDEWADNMELGFPTPDVNDLVFVADDWEKHLPKYRSLVKAFAKRFPDRIQMTDQQRMADRGKYGPWHSKRSWTAGIYMMALCEGAGELDLIFKALSGCVGEDVATEYFTWVNNLDIPDPEAVLVNPRGFTVPPRGDQVYVLASGVVAAVENKNNAQRWASAWTVIDTLVSAGFADISSAMCKRLIDCWPKGAPRPNLSGELLEILKESGRMDDDSGRR